MRIPTRTCHVTCNITLCFAIRQLNVTVHCPEYLMFFCAMPQTLRYFEPTVCGLIWVEVFTALKILIEDPVHSYKC